MELVLLVGGGDSSTASNDIVVERGPVKDGVVFDRRGNEAISNNNSNVYTFKETPNYPIVVTGGWVDINNNGIRDSLDFDLNMVMSSFTNVITPMTTVLANADIYESIELENKFSTFLGVSRDDLYKATSEAEIKVVIAINAIYKEARENNERIMDRFSYDNIIKNEDPSVFEKFEDEYLDLFNLLTDSFDENGDFQSSLFEEEIVKNNIDIYNNNAIIIVQEPVQVVDTPVQIDQIQ